MTVAYAKFRTILLFPFTKKHLSSLLIQLNVTIVTVQDDVNVRPKNYFSRSKN